MTAVHIGEIVMVRPAFSRNVPGGAYEVTKQLPHSGRELNIASRVPATSTTASPEKRAHQAIGSGACAIVAPRCAPGNFRTEFAAVAVLAAGSLLRYSSGLGAKPQRRA
jgi:hypothetical protein